MLDLSLVCRDQISYVVSRDGVRKPCAGHKKKKKSLVISFGCCGNRKVTYWLLENFLVPFHSKLLDSLKRIGFGSGSEIHKMVSF